MEKKRNSPDAKATKAIERLSSELERASAALASLSADVPNGQLVRQLVEKFRRELADIAATTAASRVPPQLTTWVLERISGGVAKTLIVQEEAGPGASIDEREYRVGCLELLDDQAWAWIDASPEGDFLRLFFPGDEFTGMPSFLDLEPPRQSKVGQNWRLLRGDRTLAAVFRLRSVEVAAGELRPSWAHGDIVRAVYCGFRKL